MEPVDTCPICGAPVSGARQVYRRQRDSLWRCGRCRSLFANPRYTPDELDQLYREEYYDEATGSSQQRWAVQEHAEVLHRTTIKALRRRFPTVIEPGRRVLDFGCGLGFFLAEAGRAGMVGAGVELSDVAASRAREDLGLDVRTGREAALDELPDGAFDLVVSWAVIEHVLRPRAVLQRLTDKLVPGGVLALSLPNVGCWRCRIEGGRWFNLANPTHLNFPTLKAAKGVLGQLGLADVRRIIYWGGRPGFGPVRNLLQYVARLLNLGSEFRIVAQKPLDLRQRSN